MRTKMLNFSSPTGEIACPAGARESAAPAHHRRYILTRRKILISLLASLTACVSVDKKSSISGRLSVKIEATRSAPARSVSANFDLQGSPTSGQLSLWGPLGGVLAQATWSPQQALLRTPDTQQIFTTLDELTQALLGEVLPIAALFDWLRGKPLPTVPSQPTTPPQLPGFEQLGWAVDTSRLADRWLIAQRALAPSVTIKVRLDL
jgi:outer membrane lipoprotein LolB